MELLLELLKLGLRAKMYSSAVRWKVKLGQEQETVGRVQLQTDEQVDRQMSEQVTSAAGDWAEPKLQEQTGSPQSLASTGQVSG